MRKADLILTGGTIHTMDPRQPLATALTIRGNRIEAVGHDDEMEVLVGPETKKVPLLGRTVIPGMTDCHTHFCVYAQGRSRVNLLFEADFERVLDKLEEAARGSPADRWVVGFGFDQNLWGGRGFPTKEDLDRRFPDRPLFVQSRDGHSAWVNSMALAKAGISGDTPDPPGGRIHRSATGEPTGILQETAAYSFSSPAGLVAGAFDLDLVKAAIAEAHSLGLTGVHSMEEKEAFEVYETLLLSGDLTLRVESVIHHTFFEDALRVGLKTGFGDERLRLGGLKVFTDGALGSQTAWMHDPYEGTEEEYGVPVLVGKELREMVLRAARAGISSTIHAIGDRANTEALNAIEAARAEGPARLRHRIEHAQCMRPDDVKRFARLGVVASMQPIHVPGDIPMADRHWGLRGARAYPFRSLLQAGATLAFGSDVPVEVLDPIQGIYAAASRRDKHDEPREGWYPQERIGVEEALRAYTLGAAFASGDEQRKGSLTPGKLADAVVLSQDILAIPLEQVRETQVMMTLFDGQIVYSREE